MAEEKAVGDPLQIVVAGFPLNATASTVQARLKQINVNPVALTIDMAASRSKYRNAKSPVTTASATLKVQNTPSVWRLIQGSVTAHFEETPDASSHMLSFWPEDRSLTNMMRMNIAYESNQARMTIPAVMHAVGFQMEDFRRFMAHALRTLGIPAVGIRMSDTTMQDRGPKTVCPWYSFHGGIEVILPSKEAYAALVRDRSRNKAVTVTLSMLYDMLQEDHKAAFKTVLPDFHLSAFNSFPLIMNINTPPVPIQDDKRVEHLRNLIPDDSLDKTVILYINQYQATSVKQKYGTTIAKMKETLLGNAKRSGAPIQDIVVSYNTETEEWNWAEGLALVMLTPDSASKYRDAVCEVLEEKVVVWEPLASTTPTGAVNWCNKYRATVASEEFHQAAGKRKRGGTTGAGKAGDSGSKTREPSAAAGTTGGRSSRKPPPPVQPNSTSSVSVEVVRKVPQTGRVMGTPVAAHVSPPPTALVPTGPSAPAPTTVTVANITSCLQTILTAQTQSLVTMMQAQAASEREARERFEKQQMEVQAGFRQDFLEVLKRLVPAQHSGSPGTQDGSPGTQSQQARSPGEPQPDSSSSLARTGSSDSASSRASRSKSRKAANPGADTEEPARSSSSHA
jgi:hypothetical protein